MRILHVSDFHHNAAWFKWLATHAPDCDLICFSGDFLDIFCDVSVPVQIRQVTHWLADLKQPLMFCSGNHDAEARGAHDGAWLRDLLSHRRRGDGSIMTIDGVTFVSSGWGNPCRLAQPAKVILRHAPPAGCATAISRADGQDWGDFNLGEDLRAGLLTADIILSGHQHAPQSWHDGCGTAMSFNPGHNAKASIPNLILIDTVRRQAAWWVDERPVDKCRY